MSPEKAGGIKYESYIIYNRGSYVVKKSIVGFVKRGGVLTKELSWHHYQEGITYC